MPDIEKIVNGIQKVLNWIFQDHVPPWILRIIGYLFAVGFLLLAIWGLLLVLSKIKKLWAENFKPLFYDIEEKRRCLRRQRFADHLESEIRRLNTLEAWSDYRFAELEAEVEAEGRRRSSSTFPFFRSTRTGLRREHSLTRALELSQDRLIILEGEPGSGKSVALRHVAQTMAQRATRATNTVSSIPIYINLKELERHRAQTIDRNLIQSFILKSLNRVNDRDVEEFLEEEFDRGLKEGTWLFLFDSFDELPEVLSSSEADATIRNYADAISAFLHGLNLCRGVVASRQFRGPGQIGWPRFRILPMSESRRLELIHRVGMEPDLEADLIGQLGTARLEINIMAGNPMFLSLLCEHIRTKQPFPENVHTVFETYIQTRLTRDKERIRRRFNIGLREVRDTAEKVAFCIAANTGLGLSPTRESLSEAMTHENMPPDKQFHLILDALEYLKLARSETAVATGDSKAFTFAHRRFQEYFSTCVVLREPTRVGTRQLLTDARWRETAVVMCQTQPAEVLLPLIEEAQSLLSEMAKDVPELIEDPVALVEKLGIDDEDPIEDNHLPISFPWPHGSLHVLKLLQDGFGSRSNELPEMIRLYSGRLVLSATVRGNLTDKKWALEVAGVSPRTVFLWMLRSAFSGRSQWLKDTSYRQVARLGEIPSDIVAAICEAITDLAIRGVLPQERYATRAHLSRLSKPAHLILVLQLLLWVPIVDLTLHIVALLSAGAVSIQGMGDPINRLIVFLVLIPILLMSLKIPSLAAFFLVRLHGAPGLVTYLRLNILALIVLIATLPTLEPVISPTDLYRHRLTIGIFLLSMIFLFWAPTAWVTARRGRFVRPYWWPVIPILSLLYFPSLIKTFLRTFRRVLKYILPITILEILVGLYGSKYLSLMLPWFVGFVGCFMLASLAWWSYDLWRWLRWNRMHMSKMTGLEFLNLAKVYSFNLNRRRFVRKVREQHLLVATTESEGLVEHLALAIERDLIHRRSHNENLKIIGAQHSNDNNHSIGEDPSVFDAWYHSEGFGYFSLSMGEKQKLSSWGEEVLDEIHMLLEQLRARKDESSSDGA
jgi:hypothetical protein